MEQENDRQRMEVNRQYWEEAVAIHARSAFYNLPAFLAVVPHLGVLNIGHSIVARAVLVGMEQAVREMKALIAR